MGLSSSHTRGLAFTSVITTDLQAWLLAHFTAPVGGGEVGERTGKKTAEGWPPPYKSRRPARPAGGWHRYMPMGMELGQCSQAELLLICKNDSVAWGP